MKNCRIIFLLAALFVTACGGEDGFDYSVKSETDGLAVNPSALSLSESEPEGYFMLSYSSGDLTLLGIDNSSLTDNFTVDPFFDASACPAEINIYGSCRLKIKYNPSGAGNHYGSLTLKFLYAGDPQADRAKDHILTITGVAVGGTGGNF